MGAARRHNCTSWAECWSTVFVRLYHITNLVTSLLKKDTLRIYKRTIWTRSRGLKLYTGSSRIS